MTDTSCRFISLSVTSVNRPIVTHPMMATTPIAAIAMLIAERNASGEWRFALRSHAVAAGDGEDALLSWATGAMPDGGTVIGWKIADDIAAPLLAAGRGGDPDIAAAFLKRLLALITVPSVDLALMHGGAGAAPLDAVAQVRNIDVPTLDAHEIESAWSLGDTRRLARHAADQAIGAWSLWLSEANGTADVVARAFEAWRNR